MWPAHQLRSACPPPDAYALCHAMSCMDACLCLAAISPDRLRDRQACLAGPFKSPLLARAAMGLALGPFPLDFQAKLQAGQAVLYVTNGFKCAPSWRHSFPASLACMHTPCSRPPCFCPRPLCDPFGAVWARGRAGNALAIQSALMMCYLRGNDDTACAHAGSAMSQATKIRCSRTGTTARSSPSRAWRRWRRRPTSSRWRAAAGGRPACCATYSRGGRSGWRACEGLCEMTSVSLGCT